MGLFDLDTIKWAPDKLGWDEVFTSAALFADWLTPKCTLRAKDQSPSLDGGWMGVLNNLASAIGIPSGQEGVVTLYHYESFTDAIDAEYGETQIRGRSQPYVHYVHTGTNKINFTAKLVAGAGQFEFLSQDDDVWKNVLTLKSWLYPTYPGSGKPLIPPPTLIMDMGDVYKSVPGIIRSLSFNAQRPFSWNNFPQIVDVDIAFEILYTTPVDRTHFKDGMRDADGGASPPARSPIQQVTDKIDSAVDSIRSKGTGLLGSVRNK